MNTSILTQNYWVEMARDWAERLSPPQQDEFNAVMDDLIDLRDAEEKRIAEKGSE